MNNSKRILLIENFPSDFYKTRLPYALFLLEKGWDVYALVPNCEYVNMIRDQGVKVIEYELDRKNKGLFQLFKLIKIYREVISKYDFNIVHSYRFQPNLLNVFANFFNSRKIIIHITGLGIAFSNNSLKYSFLRVLSQLIFQVKLLRANKVVVQNHDDIKDLWLTSILWKKKFQVVKGSGVNISIFNRENFNRGSIREKFNLSANHRIFICVTRLLWEKGIAEMVEAFSSKEIQTLYPKIQLWLVGWSDKDNPRFIPAEYIDRANSKNILFLGKSDKIPELLVASDFFLYPSYYREGIPRGILEALSMCLPIITTNLPGCNLTVQEGINWFLIDWRSSVAIIKAVKMILSRSDFENMGIESRKIAEQYFSEDIIFSEIENLYKI